MPNDTDRARLIQKYHGSNKRITDIPLEKRSRHRTVSMISSG